MNASTPLVSGRRTWLIAGAGATLIAVCIALLFVFWPRPTTAASVVEEYLQAVAEGDADALRGMLRVQDFDQQTLLDEALEALDDSTAGFSGFDVDDAAWTDGIGLREAVVSYTFTMDGDTYPGVAYASQRDGEDPQVLFDAASMGSYVTFTDEDDAVLPAFLFPGVYAVDAPQWFAASPGTVVSYPSSATEVELYVDQESPEALALFEDAQELFEGGLDDFVASCVEDFNGEACNWDPAPLMQSPTYVVGELEMGTTGPELSVWEGQGSIQATWAGPVERTADMANREGLYLMSAWLWVEVVVDVDESGQLGTPQWNLSVSTWLH